jgi:hypothetical protein
MDYEGIYRDFIADRRRKEPALIESGRYCERHHIIPRSLGGSNAKENVIRLTYRDHIFAHALLLKWHQHGEGRWYMAASMSAVLNLRNGRERERENIPIVETKYRWARRAHGDSIRGPDHPGFKHEVFSFYHVDGREFTGNRQDLIEATGLGFRAVYDMVGGRRDFCQGWCTSKEEAEMRRESDRIRATRWFRVGDGYYHVDGRFVGRDDNEGQRANGIDGNAKSHIAAKGFSEGWCNDPQEAKARAEGRWRRSYVGREGLSALDFFRDDPQLMEIVW